MFAFLPFRFLYRPIKLSFLFNPLKLQERECKKSEVILITLQPKAWRRKSTHARTDQHHFSWSAQYSDNSVGILLSSSATQRTEPREHSTQVALLNHLFSEFLFQGAGKTPLSVEGFSHFFFFFPILLQTSLIPRPLRQSPSVAQSKPVSLTSPWKFPVFLYWVQLWVIK